MNQTKLYTNSLLDSEQIVKSDDPHSFLETELRDSCELISHCFALLTIQLHVRFAGVESGGITSERYDLYSIQYCVG